MRLSFLFSFLLLLGVSTTNATILQVSGEVSGTWDVDTVQVMGDLMIPDNQSLIINPGVQVIFDDYYRFSVAGQLQAHGMQNDSIFFMVSDTSGLFNLENKDGSWAGLWFERLGPNMDSSTMEYCHFKYGKAITVNEDSVYWYGGAACVRKYSQLRFSNCSFSNNIAYKNGGAIYCRDAHIKIDHCNFKDNKAGTAIDYGYGGGLCLEYSNAKVYRNYFNRNSSTGVGGGLSFEYSNPAIEANVFYDNFSALGGGLGCIRSEQGHSIANNLFDHNASTFFGGAVAFLEADVLFTNNTVVNNASMYGGGFHINAAAKPIIKNCIIWNNTCASVEGPQICVYDVYSAPEFYHNNIEGGFEEFTGAGTEIFLGVYDQNMDLDPQFTSAILFPFSLSEESPCINAGTPDTIGLLLPEKDLAGMNRFQEDHIDMGCYENQGSSGLQNSSMANINLFVAPNPIRNQATFHMNSTHLSANAKLVIYDSNGRQLSAFDINNRTSIHWNCSDDYGNILPSGIYYYQVLDDDIQYTQKLIINH